MRTDIRKKLISIFLIALCLSSCKLDDMEKLNVNKKIKNEVYLEDKNLKGLDIEQVREILTRYSKEMNVEPKNAKFDKEKWKIEPEKKGRKINIDKTLELILKSQKGQKIEPIVEEVNPEITSERIREKIVEIGSFSTEILDDQESRVSNIEIASEYINDVKVMPGEEFSFNQVLGKRTKEKGYEKAPIIVKGKKGPKKAYGVGGGICQISTTLYNAALAANLEITERHPHSKKVPYVEKGRDATVVYGGADFKFVNNRENPIVIKVLVADGKVTVRLYEIKDTQLL